MMHEVWVHLQNNWHKYGVVFLLLKEAKDIYKFISGLKSIQETFSWLWSKLTGLFKKS